MCVMTSRPTIPLDISEKNQRYQGVMKSYGTFSAPGVLANSFYEISFLHVKKKIFVLK